MIKKHKFTLFIAAIAVSVIALSIAGEVLAQQTALEQARQLTSERNFIPGEVIVEYKSDISARDLPKELKMITKQAEGANLFDKIEVVPGEETNKIAELLRDPKIKNVQPNYLYEPVSWQVTADRAEPNDYDASRHWYYERSSLPEAWSYQGCPVSYGCGGDNQVTIAVIDSGLAAFNQEIVFDYDGSGSEPAIPVSFAALPEYENIPLYENTGEIPNNNLDDDCNGFVDDYHGIDGHAYAYLTDPTCDGSNNPLPVPVSYAKAGAPVDTYGHGSFTTGLISTEVNNSSQSVAPAFNVRVMPLAASVHFSRFYSSFAISTSIDYARLNGADVINLSLGGEFFDSLMNNAIQRAHNDGVVVVAAAGNSGHVGNPIIYPAAYNNVLAVAAVDADNTRSFYSSYGDYVDVSAYVGSGSTMGNAVWQTSLTCFFPGNTACNTDNVNGGGTTGFGIGTSYAAPQVAALAGLIKSQDSSYTGDDITNIILESAVDIADPGRDFFTGEGVIDFHRAQDLIDYYNTQFPTKTPVYRFFNLTNGGHFYTASERERDKVIDQLSDFFVFEGPNYQVFESDSAAVANVQPVFRFFNTQTGTHFYTISSRERDKIIANLPQFSYEGAVFYVFASDQVKAEPIYRFFNRDTGAHFYTASARERDKVLSNFPQFQYEGVAFYYPIN